MDGAVSRGAAVRILAGLFESVESQTPYGGRAISWEPRGSAWLKPGSAKRRERRDPAGIRVTETMTVEARADPRLIEGRVLRFGGSDWSILGCQTVGGQAIVALERTP